MVEGEDYKVKAMPPDKPKELKVPTGDVSTFQPSPEPMLTEDDKVDARPYGTTSPDRFHVSTSQIKLLTLARRCPMLRELQREVSTDSGDTDDLSHAGKEDPRSKMRRRLRKVSGNRDLTGVIPK